MHPELVVDDNDMAGGTSGDSGASVSAPAETSPVGPIYVSGADADFAQRQQEKISRVYLALGLHEAQCERERRRLMDALEQAEHAYARSIEDLARRYVAHGRWNYQTDLGAFVPEDEHPKVAPSLVPK